MENIIEIIEKKNILTVKDSTKLHEELIKREETFDILEGTNLKK